MRIPQVVRNFASDLRQVPSMAFALLVLSVVSMNLLANRELFHSSWIALDCGYAISWIPFIIMDCVCRAFGGRTAFRLSLLAIIINLATFAVFKLLMLTPGMWGEFYTTGSLMVNDALNNTVGGSTWIVFGSAFAMCLGSAVNSLVNVSVGRMFQKDNYTTFAIRSFSSTAISQFVDNFTFTLIVSVPLFGWTILQSVCCALAGAALELILEIAFSKFGYRLSRTWIKCEQH